MPFRNIIFLVASVTAGILLFLLLAIFLIDIINLIVKIPPKLGGFFVLSLAISVSAFSVWNAFQIKITEMGISVKGLKNEVRIIHISDVHIGHVRGRNFMLNLVDLTNNQNPDVVFITGDLFDGKSRLTQESIEPLSQIKASVYFVEGNHDGYAGIKTVKQYLRSLNVNVLENEIVNFGELQIVGLNYMPPDQETKGIHAFYKSTIRESLDSLYIDKTRPAVMLHHSPEGIKYASAHGIDLFLAGHTHGGQLFPVNLITKLMFSYNKGLNEFGNTKIIVSQGVGTVGPPMRVGTKSEIILIKLVPVN